MNTEKQKIIEASGLTKEFKDFWRRSKAKAVNDVDFYIKEGEIVGLLGPNGSGKSTIVKMLLGLLYPTSGSLSLFGNSPLDVEAKRRIGYLPEETYLYKYLNAYETLDFFASIFNLSKAEKESRINQLLEMVGMSHVKYRMIGEFSKGMSRRIGLAQAMINDPELLILDEPTSGLDPLGCRDVKKLIKTLKSRGKTVLVTSHLLSDIEDICDRVIILYGGKIRATGTLNDLLVIPDASHISTPLLTPEVTEKVLHILREHLGTDDFKIEHPHKSLENFFLDVIKTAKDADIETAGVSGGGDIADYLSSGVDKSKEVLSALVQDKSENTVKKEEVPEISKQKINDKLVGLIPQNKEIKQVNSEKKVEKNNIKDINDKLKDLL